nr:AraC family transcriptional regulator [Paenibacillus hamazuiensis]
MNPNKGILKYEAGIRKFSLSRHAPSEDLRFFVKHYWLLQWDLRGQAPHTQEVLQHPGVNVVIEHGASRICGITSGKSTHVLQGKGQIVGVLFRPGAFRGFIQSPASALTDRVVEVADCFDIDTAAFEEALFALENDEAKIAFVERLLRRHIPERDDTVDTLNEVIDCIIRDRHITKVEQLAEQFGITKRTLQRWFNEYVGVSPKWVIMRYRMHEAAELIESGADPLQAAMALGYADQAHFCKDFKAAVGKTPKQFARTGT